MRALSSTLLTTTLLLSACGGGGGGGDNDSPTEPPPAPTPPEAATFTVSGTIAASSSQAVDSDTNDPESEAIPNNTTLTAQPVSNPVTLGGYVNRPGTGSQGQSFTSGDIDDYYAVELLAGQTVTMIVADFQQADVDLYLYNAQGEAIDFSVATGEIETLFIEADGRYIVNAFAFSGATNYTIAIGTQSTNAAPTVQDFVAFEAIVSYKPNASRSGTIGDRELERRYGLRRLAGAQGRHQLMALQHSQTGSELQDYRLSAARHKRNHLKDDISARWETLHTIKTLSRHPLVERIEPNYRIKTFATPDDPGFSLQWHYPLIGLPDAWDTTAGNENTIVAVIDTGVLAGHPDMLGQYVEGYDFVRDPQSAADGGGIDANPTDPGEEATGSSFHGSHVSGTVAASGNNGRGVTGVAYESRVMPLRALGIDGGTVYDLMQAISYAAGLENDSGTTPRQPADVINLSLGGGSFSQNMQNLLQQVRRRGIVIVAAAGNESSMQPSYPAAYNGVISVSAVDAQRQITAYSNTGATIDVAAPGGDNTVDITGDGYPDGILSTGGDNSGSQLSFVYSFLNGTSMAAPHVAGVIALMKSINPALTPEDVDVLLSAGALTDDLGAPGRDDTYGHGLINAQSAVIAALASIGSSPADIPRLTVSSSNLNFGSTTAELRLALGNAGRGALTLKSISGSEPWLSVAPLSTDPNGLGEYVVSVDRDSVDPGIYAADLTVQSSVNDVSVRVFMSVGGEGFASDVGVLYIILYDLKNNTTVAQAVSQGNEGEYDFVIENVPPGEYELLAGSDADNDFLICDRGESCGAYINIDQPVLLQVNADLSDLNFPAEYVVALPSIASSSSERITPDRAKASGSDLRRLPASSD